MKIIIALIVLFWVGGCPQRLNQHEGPVMTDAEIVKHQRDGCWCYLWGSPRAGREIPEAWYKYRTEQGCIEYESCAICTVCGAQGHQSPDPKDGRKDV